MDQKRVGELQIKIGYFIIFLVFFLGLFGYSIVLDRLVTGFGGITESVSNVYNSSLAVDMGEKERLMAGNSLAFDVINSATHLGFAAFSMMFSLAAFCVLGLLIALLFITQGTANKYAGMSKKEQNDILKKEYKRDGKRFFAYAFLSVLFFSLAYFTVLAWADEKYIEFGYPSRYLVWDQAGVENDFMFVGFLKNILFCLLIAFVLKWIYFNIIDKEK